jgi:hypothetical protein
MIRTKKKNKNEYILAEGIWVRNPYIKTEAVDINDLCGGELSALVDNETKNMIVNSISSGDMFENYAIDNAIICSDGYDWRARQKILARIPNKSVKIIGVNGSLAKWEMVGSASEIKRSMTFYLVNNPYKECLSYLPKTHRYYPSLIASTKTNPDFIKSYKESPIFYSATKDCNYSGLYRSGCMGLDDYRNPVCAAISYCVKMGVKKLALFCCDESFDEERPSSQRMKNGLHQYPQQIRSQRIIDAQLHWLRINGVQVVDCSSGMEYENAAYISPEDLPGFFEKT